MAALPSSWSDGGGGAFASSSNSSNNNNNDDDDDDDFFFFFFGSLMNELLADLQLDSDQDDAAAAAAAASEEHDASLGLLAASSNNAWLSLEQLEQELAQHYMSPSITAPAGAAAPSSSSGSWPSASLPSVPDSMFASGPATAASLVVQQTQKIYQQQQQYPHALESGSSSSATSLKPQGLLAKPEDAWSLSMQSFTAPPTAVPAPSSLEHDFLQADTARKAAAASGRPATTRPPPGLDWSQAADYDISENLRVPIRPSTSVAPPPGLMTSTTSFAKKGAPKTQISASAPTSKVNPPLAESRQSRLLNEAAAKLETQMQLQQQQSQPELQKALPPVASALPVVAKSSLAATAVLKQTLGMTPVTAEMLRAIPKPAPPTPQNSISVDIVALAEDKAITAPAAMPPISTKPNLLTTTSTRALSADAATGPALDRAQEVKQRQEAGRQVSLPVVLVDPAPQPQLIVPAHPAPAHMPPMTVVSQSGPPMGHMMPGPSPHPATYYPPPAMPSPRGIFCNPHPHAPPIPASRLESRYMKARDINYVIHGILKPVLAAAAAAAAANGGISTTMDDYHVQYWMRLAGGAPVAPLTPGAGQHRSSHQATHPRRGGGNLQEQNAVTTTNDGTEDNLSNPENSMVQEQQNKAKEWSTQHAVLGHVVKSNVARPRALIAAQPITASSHQVDEAEEVMSAEDAHIRQQKQHHKQRATVWKSRILCDQAYQAYHQIVACWRRHQAQMQQQLSNPSIQQSLAVTIQPFLYRILKCFGILQRTEVINVTVTSPGASAITATTDYSVDVNGMQLILKLHKGRILLARVLEQALFPPKAVQVALPAIFECVWKKGPPAATRIEGMDANVVDDSDDRLFAALTRIVTALPDLGRMPPSSSNANDTNSVTTSNVQSNVLIACLKAVTEGATSNPVASSSLSSSLATSSSRMTVMRMQCIHALLHRGSREAEHDPIYFAPAWQQMETSFLQVLEGMS